MGQGSNSAFSRALALESASDSRYDSSTGEFTFTADELADYAKIVAYKVTHNIGNGFKMDPNDDPLTYIDCGLENIKPVDWEQ